MLRLFIVSLLSFSGTQAFAKADFLNLLNLEIRCQETANPDRILTVTIDDNLQGEVLFDNGNFSPTTFDKKLVKHSSIEEVTYKARLHDGPDKISLTFSNGHILGFGGGYWSDKNKRYRLDCEITKGLDVKAHKPTLISPIIKKVGDFLGDTRLGDRPELISADQMSEASGALLPGDILVERRNWFLSNMIISEFWTHSILHIGTVEEARNFFNNDPEVKNYYSKLGFANFVDYIEAKYPDQFVAWNQNNRRLMESTSDGVNISTFGDSDGFLPDYSGAIRPRLSVLEKAIAIEKAMKLFGHKYDYDFDFTSPDAIVCSELIVRSYLPGENTRGIHFESSQMPFGKRGVSPNSLVEFFYKHRSGTKALFDFVYYLGDGESKKERFFLQTWQKKGGLKVRAITHK